MFCAQKRFVVLAVVALLAATTSVAQATIISNLVYELGEGDSGAGAGVVVDRSEEALHGAYLNPDAPSHALTKYSSDTPGVTRNGTSTLSVQFGGDAPYNTGAFGSIDSLLPGTTNWGLECWVKGGSGDTRNIAYLGNSNSDGYGLFFENGTYKGLLGGRGVVGDAAPVSGAWTHLALVDEGGTTTFYVNGVASGSSLSTDPHLPSGIFTVGGSWPAGVGFNGLIDSVRLFHFNTGEFQVTDLNTAVPEPSAIAMLAMGLVGILAYGWRKRR